MIDVQVTTLESVSQEWDDLAERAGAAPFVRPGWIEAWWGAFGRGELRVLAARRDGALVGILPVIARHGVFRSPTNEHTPTFDVLAVDAPAARALSDALLRVRARWVTFGRLAAGGVGQEALEACGAQAGYRTSVATVARSPYITCAATLEEHERAISRNLRHDVQRRMRRLCEQGAVTIEITDDVPGALEEGFAVEALSWKGRQGTAIASDPRTRSFYEAVARWGAARGWLRLAFLRLDGRPLAFQFDLEAGGTYYSLKIGYDPAMERYSPGKLLAYEMVARAVSAGLATYELLGTDDPWKERWTAAYREQIRLDLFARSPAGTASWVLGTHGRRLARRVPLASRAAAVLRR